MQAGQVRLQGRRLGSWIGEATKTGLRCGCIMHSITLLPVGEDEKE